MVKIMPVNQIATKKADLPMGSPNTGVRSGKKANHQNKAVERLLIIV
jgi:hypothetical protein